MHFEVYQGCKSELKTINGKLNVISTDLNYFHVGGVRFNYTPKWPKTIDAALQKASEYCDTMNKLFPQVYWESIQKIKYNGPIDKPYIKPEDRTGKFKEEFENQSKELAKLVNIG